MRFCSRLHEIKGVLVAKNNTPLTYTHATHETTMSRHAVARRAAPRHAAPRHAMPRHAMPRRAIPRRAVPRRAVPGRAAPGRAAPRSVVPRPMCHAAPRRAAPRRAVPRRAAAPSRRSPSRRAPSCSAPSCSAPSCRAPTTQTRMPIGLGWPAQHKGKKISNKQSGLPGCRTKHELSIGVRVRASFSITCSPPILATSCQALAALGERERPITSQRHHQARAPKLQCPWLYYNDLKRPHGAPRRGGRRAAWT